MPLMHKIAIVDDAKDSRDFLYYLLRDEFDILRYENGEEALGKIRDDKPELMLLDIRLRGIDGVEVLNRIRNDEAVRALPVFAVTANAMVGDREKYLAAGFDEYISKPIIDVDQFLEIIRRHLPHSGSA